jgi:alkylation response protein AidB-like acyl-CoA dehydrogenase
MFMPPSSHEDDEFHGAGLSNLEYALLSEEMGHISWASEVFNCSAPDTGNMEVFIRYGTKEQKRKWLRPLMGGEIRSAFQHSKPGRGGADLLRRHQNGGARPQLVLRLQPLPPRGDHPGYSRPDPRGHRRERQGR